VKDIHNSAGLFARNNIINFPNELPDSCFDSFAKSKQISYNSVPDKIAQTAVLNELVLKNSLRSPVDSDDTVIVLADEKLLIPVINSLSGLQEKLNVTMGYPLQASQSYSLMQFLLDFYSTNYHSHIFHVSEIISTIKHPFVFNIDVAKSSELVNSLHKNQSSTTSIDELIISDLHRFIFCKTEKPRELSIQLIKIVDYLHQFYSEVIINFDKNELEFLSQIWRILCDFEKTINLLNQEISIQLYVRLLKKILQNSAIPFQGEQFTKLQIMGMLETRLLDFKKVIMLSATEESLSGKASQSSFIPYNLRLGYGLPTIEQLDAINTYYFYRLIQRAETVDFIYYSCSQGQQAVEMSRYLFQLKHIDTLKITENNYVINTGVEKPKEITIHKNEQVLNVLKKYVTRDSEIKSDSGSYLSPSAIITYRNCSLKFYFRYVLGLKEVKQLNDEIDAADFGSVLHLAMEKIYSPYIGVESTASDANKLVENEALIHEIVCDSYGELIKSEILKPDSENGKRDLVIETIKKYVKQIVLSEVAKAPLKIISLENEYFKKYTIKVCHEMTEIRIGGKIDRLDKVNSGLRIIDYKTGEEEMVIKNFSTLFDCETILKEKAALQLLIYSDIVSEYYSDVVYPEIYLIKDVFGQNVDSKIYVINENSEMVVLSNISAESFGFKESFKKMLEEIFDPQVPFQQTCYDEVCEYCEFSSVCNR
jgi:hypothetical protein